MIAPYFLLQTLGMISLLMIDLYVGGYVGIRHMDSALFLGDIFLALWNPLSVVWATLWYSGWAVLIIGFLKGILDRMAKEE